MKGVPYMPPAVGAGLQTRPYRHDLKAVPCNDGDPRFMIRIGTFRL